MRLGTLSIIASALLAMTGVALAQREADDYDSPPRSVRSTDEAPLPPAPSQPLPPVDDAARPASGERLPAWQAPPGYGGYGGWTGGAWGDGGHGCGACGGCNDCNSCRSCRPGLICRIKSLRNKLCAALACRRSCRRSRRASCCSSCCSSCGDGSFEDQAAPASAPQRSLLPAPPADAVPYDGGDVEENLDDTSAHRPAEATMTASRRHYAMPRMTSAHKATSTVKRRR